MIRRKAAAGAGTVGGISGFSSSAHTHDLTFASPALRRPVPPRQVSSPKENPS